MRTRDITCTLLSFLLMGSCVSDTAIEKADAQKIMTKAQNENYIQVEEAFPNQETELVTFSSGLTLEKLDSIYILDGDILLTQEQVNIMNNNLLHRSAAIISPVNYWEDNTVHYTFASGFLNQSNVLEAMREWEENTCIRFLPKTDRDKNYVEFFQGDGAYSSFIGQVGGKQQISLGDGTSIGNAIHEIGHTVGLFHEHTRDDRDDHIIINWNNIQRGTENNFKKYSDRGIPGVDVGTFDFNSVMLYGSFAFSSNGSATITRRDGSTFIGQRNFLSPEDIQGVVSMYGPPFARLEKQTTTQIWTSDEQWTRTDNYIIFYTDKTPKT